jgi:hypothetical protein
MTHWREPGKKPGKRVLHCIFTMGPRQASKYGKATAPRLYVEDIYSVLREGGERIFMRLYRQAMAAYSVRCIWMKKVKKPKDWPE